ncbi:growth hormone secretagogue receptor type 1 [Scleropages formosus]|uniref:growth hormone secretagogue receptor type 1 n=1 Tax=Scleropages formosus TaxID=113540 RepID=UPI0010FAAFBA|nr:growth hormone secretagogue receptor type 1 [Scleropages formosus]
MDNCSLGNGTWEGNATRWRAEHPAAHLFPVPVLTGVTATCALLFLAGVTGNALTVVLVAKFKDMRTTTNLYLCSMAVSDLLVLLWLPLDLYRVWRYRPWGFGQLLCKLFQFVSESCTYSSILSITALSVERYLAICFPLRAKVLVTRARVRGLLAALWLVSLCSAGPVVVLVGVQHEPGTDPRATSECKPTEFAIRSGLLTAMVWVSSGFFFLPVFCLTVLYGLIGRKLCRRSRATPGAHASVRDKSNRQTVRMLAVVVFAFVLCWLPFHVGRYLISKSSEAVSPLLSQITQYCNLVSFVLFYLSAAINPVLYNIMSRKYRTAACQLFGVKRAPRRTASGVKGDSSLGCAESSVSL